MAGTKTSKVRVRIAPSPTGFAHIGTAYVALLNYAFARSKKGSFIVRIEDSDLKRNVGGAENKIYNALSWLGIDWDEGGQKGGSYGPYKLSDRLDLYKKKAYELVSSGKAYEDSGAIRFKNTNKDISWEDLILGEITVPGETITDFVLLKSDGYPTYNFNVVVDDIAMKISHIIRGEDHVSNTPRQLALYEAFGTRHPFFAHHPVLQNYQKKKLSKRDAAVDIEQYKERGYLPEALVNFLCLLGWSHPKGEEIFSLDEFVSNFDIGRVRSSGAIFDVKKLDWINGEYIRQLKVDDLSSKFEIRNSKFRQLSKEKRIAITKLIQTRIKTLGGLDEMAGFFFDRPKVDKSYFGKGYKKHLRQALEVFEDCDKWEREVIDRLLLDKIDDNNFKTGDFFMDLRVAISGSRFTPPINDSIIILGKSETVARIKSVLSKDG